MDFWEFECKYLENIVGSCRKVTGCCDNYQDNFDICPVKFYKNTLIFTTTTTYFLKGNHFILFIIIVNNVGETGVLRATFFHSHKTAIKLSFSPNFKVAC